MEGNLSGSLAELQKPDRQASWHFSNSLSGTLYQHYALSASCWASGNWEANTRYVAVESEGFAGNPLTPAQVSTVARLCSELGFTKRGLNLFEHNEVAVRWSPNAGPTACPSHRYDEAFAAFEEDDMTPQEREEHRALVSIFGGRTALLKAQADGMDYLLGYAMEQADQDKLEEFMRTLQAQGVGTVGPHSHRTTQMTITTGEVIQG